MTPVEAPAGVPKGPGKKAGMSKGKYKALMLAKGKCKSKAAIESGKGKGTHPGGTKPTPPASPTLTIPDTPPQSTAGGTQTAPKGSTDPPVDANMTPEPRTAETMTNHPSKTQPPMPT